MAEKDILEKVLMAHSDVFADCGNRPPASRHLRAPGLLRPLLPAGGAHGDSGESVPLSASSGITIGETRLGNLIQALLKEKKFSEIDAVSTNRKRRHELYKQYGI